MILNLSRWKGFKNLHKSFPWNPPLRPWLLDLFLITVTDSLICFPEQGTAEYTEKEEVFGVRPRAETNKPSKRDKGFLQQHQPATQGSMGVDVKTTVDITLIDSNVQKIPSNAVGPLFHQTRLIVLPGVIDADYTGRIHIMVYTVCPPLFIPKGSRIAQIIAIDNPLGYPPESDVYRGDCGFGSTG
uniref:dUTPase-like domain-containing protein n=1 Tax=Calidris pygmaea TaxID=425635 RepID=A0A8C3KCZ0_9CHAR